MCLEQENQKPLTNQRGSFVGERLSMMDRLGAAFSEQHLSSDWTLIDRNRSVLLSQKIHGDQKQPPSVFASNEIRTSKYTWLTFLPLNLLSQYQKAANVYFTFIAWLQTIKLISITDGQPLMLVPLTFVLAISMVKDAWEDHKRKKADAAENRQPASVYR